MSDKRKKVYFILIALILVSIGVEILFAHPHYHMIWNEIAGFDILIGFAGAWLLIAVAKLAMARLLQRSETYYDEIKQSSSEKDSDGGGEDVR